MKKKRVLFLIPTLSTGGAENVLINLVNNMDFKQFEITVQTLFDKDSQKNRLNSHIRYKYFLKNAFKGNSKIFPLVSAKVLYKLIVKEEYDIVISYLQGPTTYILSGCPFENTKKVAWVHTAFDSKKSFCSGFKSFDNAVKVYRSYDKIAFVAKDVKERFEDISGIVSEKNTILYNTIESDRVLSESKESINDISFSNKAINLISVGKIESMKGYDRLVRVHKRLIEEGLKHSIYILGEGLQKSKLENYINNNGLADSFSFLGFKNNPYKYVANADLYVCSSRREGFSTAVTESLIVGTPVISTNCSGARELLGYNNEYGIVTDNTEDALYEGIKRVLEDHELLRRYKVEATKRGAKFNKEKTVNDVEEMFHKIVES